MTGALQKTEVFMNKELTTIEVIGMAVRSEEDALHFYKKIAAAIKNQLVASKFEELAREEGNHRTILINLYRMLSGTSTVPPKIPGSPETAEKGRQEPSEDLEGALKIAILRELEAHNFYAKAAANATDLGAQRTLEYLSGLELGHKAALERELEAYLRDRDWYANNPDLMLVG